ncbi:UNVERIFIED_CONTAM: hypothetical protein Sindi_0375000, partial [Sesamum indicum]
KDVIEHVSGDYSFAKLVWALSHVPRRWVARQHLNVETWMRRAHDRLHMEEFTTFLMIVGQSGLTGVGGHSKAARATL